MSSTEILSTIDTSLLRELDPDGKLNLAACLQCARCSSGCTMRAETDFLPHQLNRMAMLGLRDRLLASTAIWTCASCHTCVSRCPMQVNTPALIDRLREIAAEAPAEREVRRIRAFNRAMLNSMRRFGRVYEFAMMGEYKLRARDWFADMRKLPMMLRKGKIRILPPRVRGRAKVAEIFNRVCGRRSGQ